MSREKLSDSTLRARQADEDFREELHRIFSEGFRKALEQLFAALKGSDKTKMASGGYWQLDKGVLDTNKHMLETGLGADVCFRVGPQTESDRGVEMRAHKFMLVSRSPVFETMFYGNLPESSDVIQLPDVTPQAFSNLLEYMYTESCELDDLDTVLHTVYAAKKYMLPGLTRMAVRHLDDTIATGHVCHVLEQAAMLDEGGLVASCMAYIQANAGAVVKEESFTHLSEPILRMIIQDGGLMLQEVHLLTALLRWARYQCRQETDSSFSNSEGESYSEVRRETDSAEYSPGVAPSLEADSCNANNAGGISQRDASPLHNDNAKLMPSENENEETESNESDGTRTPKTGTYGLVVGLNESGQQSNASSETIIYVQETNSDDTCQPRDQSNDQSGDIEEERMRARLGSLLSLMRLPLVPWQRLLRLNRDVRVLSEHQMQDILLYQTGMLPASALPYSCSLRGCHKWVRFRIKKDFTTLSLVRKKEKVRCKATFEIRAISETPVTILALTLLCGPYLIRISVLDPDGQMVSYTERDFTEMAEAECCREVTVVLSEPVRCSLSEEFSRIEVYLSDSDTMFWYDNIIVAKFTGGKPFKVRHSTPEVISKIHYLTADY